MSPLPLFDPGLNIAAQQFNPVLTAILAAGKDLDSPAVYLAVIALLYVGFHPKYGIRLAVLFGIAGGLNDALKLFFHLPRPYWISSAVKAYNFPTSFGFPSGGAMFSTVVYGYAALVVRRYWVVAVCLVLAAWTILARIFSGVHFVLDVLGGMAFGVLLLVLFFVLSPKVEAFAAGLRPRERILGILFLSALPLLVALPAYVSLAGWQVPTGWVTTAMVQAGIAINPVQVSTAWQSAGLILGSLLGYEFLRSRGGWNPPAEFRARAAVAAAGVITTLALYGLAKAALALPGAVIPSPVVLFIPVALAGFWFTACVPLLARRGLKAIRKKEDGVFLPRQP